MEYNRVVEKGMVEGCKDCEKLKMKLKMMEISFELINNDRNRLIRQLAECEMELEN